MSKVPLLLGKKPTDFETAITSAGFGKFNVLLILIAVPSGISAMFESTAMSYVFPAAQCDLNLSLEHKGLLNAITYIGMISSGFMWGFLCDTFGRRKLLLFGFFLDAIFATMGAFSQNVAVLIVSKFLGGFIINGPFSALTSYLAEFHSAKQRPRVQLLIGIVISLGNLILPLMAWAILPLDLKLQIPNTSVELHSWNIYLLLCATPALMSAIIFIFMPESPKFLMASGKNEQALEVFKMVYCVNTGKPPESYPVKELIKEKRVIDEGSIGRKQVKPIFMPPYLCKLLLVCANQLLIMMGLNTLRLWLPQIFQAISDYEYYNNGTTANLCTMMEIFQPAGLNVSEACFVNLENNASAYINSGIVALASIVGLIIGGVFINLLGKKAMMVICSIISGSSALALYYSQNAASTTVLSSVYMALASLYMSVNMACVVDLFPTSFRTMTVSLTMTMGRLGAISGNLVFPVLLQQGCAAPFFSVGSVILGGSVIVPVLACSTSTSTILHATFLCWHRSLSNNTDISRNNILKYELNMCFFRLFGTKHGHESSTIGLRAICLQEASRVAVSKLAAKIDHVFF